MGNRIYKMQEMIQNNSQLPTPSGVALQILQAVKEEKGFEDIGNIIKADPALSAKVLRVANSSLFGLSGQVGSLAKATSLMGTDMLLSIALSFVVVDSFGESVHGGLDMDRFWRRAVISGVACEMLAEMVGERKELFISALLQDVGILVFFMSEPHGYLHVRDDKRLQGCRLAEAEKEYFGFDHGQLGASLLKKWNLPRLVYAPIQFHNAPKSAGAYKKEAYLVKLANDIASLYCGAGLYSKMEDIRHALVDDWGWSIDRVEELLNNLGGKARELLDVFALSHEGIKPFEEIMEEALREAGKLKLSYRQLAFELQYTRKSAETLAEELRIANETIREMEVRDGLTGLYNHGYFQDYLQRRLGKPARRADADAPVAVMLLDIDHFYKINDKYGYVQGNTVLRQFGQVLSALVRNCDLVARYGGDEFVVLLPETTLARAKVLSHRVRRGIEQASFKVGEEVLSLTASIGIVSTENVEEKSLLNVNHSVDQALIKAKQLGRNRVEA